MPVGTTGQAFRSANFRTETLVAGAVSGLISEVVAHPFETISHRAKVHPSSGYGGLLGNGRLILAQGTVPRRHARAAAHAPPLPPCDTEGWRGIMAGVSVPLLVAAPSTAGYFGVYHVLKQWGLGLAGKDHASAVILGAGAAAELVTTLLVLPSEVIKSRLQLGSNPSRATGGMVPSATNFRGMWHAGRSILHKEGARGLWAGLDACLIQDVAIAGLVFLFYEHVRAVRLRCPCPHPHPALAPRRCDTPWCSMARHPPLHPYFWWGASQGLGQRR